jgi:hypothetical protein
MDPNREPRRDPNDPRRADTTDRGLSTGAIIAIVVAVLLVLLLILALGGVFGDPTPPPDATPTPPQGQIELQPGQPDLLTLPLLYTTPQLA